MALKTYGKVADEIENEGGGVQTPGWYKAIVEDAGPAPKEPLKDMRFVFQVTEGLYKSAKVTQYITNPEYGKDEEASRKLNNRLLSFASRLGLWDGASPDPDPQWDECIGDDVVIHVELNQYPDPKNAKLLVTKYSLAYLGVYPPDHPKIPDEVRKALNLPPARKAEASKPATPTQRAAQPAKKREETSDI